MSKPEKYDFGGYATRNDMICSDGLIIRENAFAHNNGKSVPLVWNHKRDVKDVLGHVVLENRNNGVYAYGIFNGTEQARQAKELIKHGDITNLSIWANNLQKDGNSVIQGNIREVSLVLAGANPGAFIESVIAHSEPMDIYEDEGIIYTDDPLELEHAATNETVSKEDKEKKDMAETEEKPKEKTIQDVVDSMTKEQQDVMYALISMALKEASKETGDKKEEMKQSAEENKETEEKEEDDKDMKYNIFSDSGAETKYLSHSEQQDLINQAKRHGSLRDFMIAKEEEGEDLIHAIDITTGMTTATGSNTYGLNDPDMLFPEYRSLNTQPAFISRNTEWVQSVLSTVRRSPFSRVKSVYADITEDEARAKGYIKGNQKKEEVFTTLKRTTAPQTIYKKQKLDRDDIIDITDFDVVAWIRSEMRVMLNEEIARAILIGDGRMTDAEDKIKEDSVRPIATDVPLFNTTVVVNAASTDEPGVVAKNVINSAIRARKNYKGSGNPTFYTTEDVLTEMLLIEDTLGHKLYKTEAELTTALRVSAIVTVEAMDNHTVKYQNEDLKLLGVIVNMIDYNVGADRGGEINLFDDFDIDFNQYKYLIETRISGALVKPFSAITLLQKTTV